MCTERGTLIKCAKPNPSQKQTFKAQVSAVFGSVSIQIGAYCIDVEERNLQVGKPSAHPRCISACLLKALGTLGKHLLEATLGSRLLSFYTLSVYPISGLTEYAFMGPLLSAPQGGQKGANSGCRQAQIVRNEQG